MGRLKEALLRGELHYDHRARRTDPDTSHASARGSSGKPARYISVLGALNRFGAGGGTCYEIAKSTGMTHVQVARCMKNLVDRCLVIDSEKRRPGDTGYDCIVWSITPSGSALFRDVETGRG